MKHLHDSPWIIQPDLVILQISLQKLVPFAQGMDGNSEMGLSSIIFMDHSHPFPTKLAPASLCYFYGLWFMFCEKIP